MIKSNRTSLFHWYFYQPFYKIPQIFLTIYLVKLSVKLSNSFSFTNPSTRSLYNISYYPLLFAPYYLSLSVSYFHQSFCKTSLQQFYFLLYIHMVELSIKQVVRHSGISFCPEETLPLSILFQFYLQLRSICPFFFFFFPPRISFLVCNQVRVITHGR